MKKLFINSVLIVMIFLSSLLAEGDESSVTDDVVTAVSFADTIISNMAALDKQADGINLKITPQSKNLLESITDLLETDLQNTTKLSNNILANLDNEILMYKSNKSLVDKLLKYKALEESRLTNTYLKQQSKILSLKALNNVGTVLNLYAFKKSIDNIVQKVEYDKRLTKFDYMDVLSTLISFNPIGAVGSQLYEIEKDIDKAMDITTGINETYKDSIWAIRDQYFNQYHILAQRGFAGKSKDNFIELFKKQRESLRNQLINLLDEIENSVILYGKDETIKVLSNAYDLISLDKESEIITKQENIYDKFYQYYLEKEKLTKEYKKIQDIDIFSGTLHLNDPINTSHQAENLKAKLFLGITPNETFNNGVLKGNIGDRVEIIFSSSGLNITDFVKEANDKGVGDTLKLWYYPEDSSTIKSITLEQNSSMSMDGFYSYYFNMQDAQIQFVKLTYNDPDRDGLVAFEFDNAYMEFEVDTATVSKDELLSSVLTDSEKTSYKECIANGGTKIGCRVGVHIVGSIDINGLAYSIIVSGKYAYVADYGSDLLKIIDISDPINPILKSSIYTYDIQSVTVSGNYAYVADNDAGLKIIDISDPTNPTLKGSINTYKAQSVTVSGNYAYVADNDAGLKIIDISNPTNPTLKGSIDTDGYVKDVTVSGNYAYVADSYRGLKIIDISNPTNPILKSSIDTDGHAFSVIVSGKYAYVADYGAGLKIIDISNPTNPTLKGSMDTNGYAEDVTVSGNYAYVIDGGAGLKIIDISNPTNPILKGSLDTDSYAYSVSVSGNYLYVADWEAGLKIIDISNPTNTFISIPDTNLSFPNKIVIKNNNAYIVDRGNNTFNILNINNILKPNIVGSVYIEEYAYDLKIYNEYAYIPTRNGLKIVSISDSNNPKLINSYGSGYQSDIEFYGNYAFLATSTKLECLDISDPSNILQKYSIDYNNNNGPYELLIYKNYLYVLVDSKLEIFDITHPANPILKKTINDFSSGGLWLFSDHLYSSIYGGMQIYDLSNPTEPNLLSNTPVVGGGNIYDMEQDDNYLIITGNVGTTIFDIKNLINPKKIAELKNNYGEDLASNNGYLYIAGDFQKLNIVNLQKAILKYNYYHPTTFIYLTDENYQDGTVIRNEFTKEWTFSEDISDFDIKIVSNSYGNISTDSFVKNGNKLSINLTPDTSKTINKLVLKFTNNGDPVKVSGSDTFWSITRTNHPPRLADGQITQLVSATNEPAFLEIETYDGDGDKVSLSIEDSAGGYVGFSKDDPSKIFASFNDGNTTHTIKIGLSDGKEKVIVPLQVLQFNKSSIEDFYSDVDKDAGDYPFDGIAFGTLEGVIWGQPDPNDSNKRVFRPKDVASMAEALAMIINAEKKAGLIQLASANEYMDVYPSWAMPYYTYARECGALDKHILNLADIYPTRENIAKIIVKTLGLDQQKLPFDVNATFSDSQDFSDARMLYYAKIAKTFGLFMLSENAKPKEHINRAELAQVIEKIFMIPQADLILEPSSADYGETFAYKLNNVKSKAINSSFELYDNIGGIKTYIITDGKSFDTKTIDNTNLAIGPNTIYAVLDNNGVKNITKAVYTVNFSDQDGDGVQDKDDKWIDDPRYAFDKNDNGIPDILDKIYKLDSYKADDNVVIGDTSYSIIDIIKNGGIYTIEQKSISKIKKGWNLLSGDIDMDMLNNPNIQVAWSYKNGKWSAYSWNNQIMQEINDKEIQTLNELNETQGVWIKASKDLELNLKDTNITGYILKDGWNLLGANRELNATYFSNSCAKYIWKYDNTLENSWRVYIFDDNISSSYPYSFDSIRKGEGFWLRCKRSDPSLLAFYKFDNGEYDNTKINDMSYSGHTLFVSGSWYSNDPYIKPHIIDSVYQWNDTYLELNSSKLSSNSFTDVNISDALTIMAYIKTDNENGNFPIISFADKGTSDLSFGSSILGINLYYPSHSGWKFSLQVKNINGDTYQIFPSNEKSIEIGKFYHIAYVIYKNGDIKVYYNGVEGIGAHIDNLAIFQEGIINKKLILGGGMGKDKFVGGLDDIMIFNKALRSNEIKSMYIKTIE